jgi:hypothetical protein
MWYSSQALKEELTNMNRIYVLIVAFSILVAMAILGCGGNGGTESGSGVVRKHDGTYAAYAFQTRDNGGAYVAEMTYTITDGQVTGTSTLLYWSSFEDEEPDVLRTETITGSVSNYWSGGPDYLTIVFDDGRGGGENEDRFLDVGIHKLREWTMCEMAYSNLNDDEFRYDWGFGMFEWEDMGRAPKKTLTEIKDLIIKHKNPR